MGGGADVRYQVSDVTSDSAWVRRGRGCLCLLFSLHRFSAFFDLYIEGERKRYNNGAGAPILCLPKEWCGFAGHGSFR